MMTLKKFLSSLLLLASLAGFSQLAYSFNAGLYPDMSGAWAACRTAWGEANCQPWYTGANPTNSNCTARSQGVFRKDSSNYYYCYLADSLSCSSPEVLNSTTKKCEIPACTYPGKTNLPATDPSCVPAPTCTPPQVLNESQTQCVAPPGPSPQQQEAIDKFNQSATEDGFDETAKTAGAAAALAAYDAWIAAGKTQAQAVQAAESSGLAVAAENVQSRLLPYAATMKTACSESATSTACNTAQSAYQTQSMQMGLNPNESYKLVTRREDGSSISYLSSPSGWQAYETSPSGKVTKYLGDIDHLTFSPTKTTEPTIANNQPASTQVHQPQLVSPPSPIFTDPAANPMPIVTPENRTLTTVDPATGEVTSRVTLLNDGTVVTTGTPPTGAADMLRRALAASSAISPTGAGSSGSVKIDETGVARDTSLSSAYSALEQAVSDRVQQINSVGNRGALDWVWSSSVIPTGACGAFDFSGRWGAVPSIDICSNGYMESLRALLAWLYAIGVSIYIWHRISDAPRGGR